MKHSQHARITFLGTAPPSARSITVAQDKHTVVLVVEDEVLIRLLAAETLVEAGFDVLEAGDADEAVKILEAHADVGVLFTDINMPGGLDGADLVKLVRERWPKLRVVVTSGRNANADAILPPGGRFVAKPYQLCKLPGVITDVLDQS
jgi:CheY-like chemotaxis protein